MRWLDEHVPLRPDGMECGALARMASEIVRATGRRTGAILWAAALLALASGWAETGRAQSSQGYDPYSQTSASGQTGSSGSGNNATTGAQPGAQQPTAATDAFNPTLVPDYSAHNTGDFNDTLRPYALGGQFLAGPKPPRPIPAPSEFERFVAERAGRTLPRFGAALLLDGAQGFARAATATVPPDYVLNPGDQLLIGVTGSVEADLRAVIDTEGRVFIPRIGSVNVAGIRYGDAAKILSRHFSQKYKKVEVTVVIGHLHGLTVYVTGYAVTPGSFTVSSLSTMVDAVLAAGGPAGGGSFRNVQLRRGGRVATTLDLYDLLLNGDTSHDAALQNEDVINIGPVGPEIAITGSVNAEAIYEVKPGEALADIIRYSGGLNSLADRSRLLVSRLADLDNAGSRQMDFSEAKTYPAEAGDIVRVLSLADVARPLERQAVLTTIEGEVDHPGRYYLKPGSTLRDLLGQSGGLTGGAFVYGTQFHRDTIQQQQQASFDRAIEDLQLDASASPLSGINSLTPDRTAAAAARSQAALSIIDRLKARKPDGRLVLALSPEATNLPGDLSLENNDRIYVPPRPKTVGVFGAVYETGSFIFSPGSRLGAYLRLAGGPKRIADRKDIFVVRANGSVLSMHQTRDFEDQPALPGDVIFVPIKTSGGGLEKLLAISSLVYQFGITALTLTALGL
jgi:protein involved in polysaccharide export with SLBB domain